MIFRRPRPAISANYRNYNELRANIPKARQISVYRRRTGKTAPNTGSKCGGSEKAPTGGSKQGRPCGFMLSLVVLSLLIVAGATRSPRPRPLQIYTAPVVPAGTHWKNRPNIFYTGVVVEILKDGPGATLTGRTMFSRVTKFKVGVQTNVQARKVCKDYGNNGNTATGADHEEQCRQGNPFHPTGATTAA